MKHLVLSVLLLFSLNANEHRLLITGFTIHEQSVGDNGVEFNAINYGLGYEFTTFNEYNSLYFGTNFTLMQDSYFNPQYTLSISPNVRFKMSENSAISFGLAAFGMYKKETYLVGIDPDEAGYGFIFGAAPLSAIYYKDVNINFAYVPSFSYKDINVIGFVITYFGWTFSSN